MFQGNKVTSNFPPYITENASRQNAVSFTLRLHYPWHEASSTHWVE